MKNIFYDWLQLVEKALVKTQQLPTLEENFPFPWEDASRAIGSGLKRELNLSSSKAGWKGHDEALKGLGGKPVVMAIEMAPIEGAVFFALSEQDVVHLTQQSLGSGEGFSNNKLREGFYAFLLLKTLEALDHLKTFKDVSFHLSAASTIPAESAFCIDISCGLTEKTLQGRLICPQSFLNNFKTHQPMQKGTLLSANIELDLSLRCEVGHTSLSQEEWDKIQVGDFIVLDRCSYDPSEEKGSITLLLGDTPLLLTRMKSEGMKVLDYAFYQEEKEPPAEITEESAPAAITLTAETGHVSLPLSRLLHVEPGTMLDLVMRPEQGVDITLGGKKVAHGELLKLGETFGLRILELIK